MKFILLSLLEPTWDDRTWHDRTAVGTVLIVGALVAADLLIRVEFLIDDLRAPRPRGT
jgi:hypothetical protein